MKKQILLLIAPLIFSVVQISGQVAWQTKTNRFLSGPCKAVTYRGKIYAASTLADKRIVIEEYDPVKNTWYLKKAKSHTDNGGEFCVAAAGTGIYFMGGWIDTSSNKSGKGMSLDVMEKYDVEKDTFIRLDRMPVGLDCAAAVSVNNIIYVLGGRAKDIIPLSNSVYAYDTQTGRWTEKNPSSHGRVEALAEVVEGKIYLFGGYRVNEAKTDIMIDNKMDVYDPGPDTWESGESDLVAADKNPLGMGVIRNEIYFIVMGTKIEEVYKYDPVLKSTVRLSDRSDLTWLMGAVSINDSIYFIGGIKGEFPNGEQQNSTIVMKRDD